MIKVVDIFIDGFPTVKKKCRGDKSKPQKWAGQIFEATKKYVGCVGGACKMSVLFMFDQSQYPRDLPFGPDLDNYLKSFQDVLNKTVFNKVAGGDSSVVELIARKRKAKRIGARLRIWQ